MYFGQKIPENVNTITCFYMQLLHVARRWTNQQWKEQIFLYRPLLSFILSPTSETHNYPHRMQSASSDTMSGSSLRGWPSVGQYVTMAPDWGSPAVLSAKRWNKDMDWKHWGGKDSVSGEGKTVWTLKPEHWGQECGRKSIMTPWEADRSGVFMPLDRVLPFKLVAL